MRCNKIWQSFKARLHITYINPEPAFLGCKGTNGGRSYGDGTRSRLVDQFPSFVAIFFSLRKYADVIENTLFLRGSLFLKWFFTGMGRLKGTEHMEAPSNRLLPTEVISDPTLFVYPLRGAIAKNARVSHKMARFVLKIAHLAFSMEPTQLLRKVSSYGLLPRLWLLKPQKKKKHRVIK